MEQYINCFSQFWSCACGRLANTNSYSSRPTYSRKERALKIYTDDIPEKTDRTGASGDVGIAGSSSGEVSSTTKTGPDYWLTDKADTLPTDTLRTWDKTDEEPSILEVFYGLP